MDRRDQDERLSRISTQWTMVFQAHDGARDAVGSAQAILIQRYAGAAYRYLLGAVRDPDTAEDLAQEFALRFLRGSFCRADPGRGRFRDYLKAALIHLVDDFYRERQNAPRPLPSQAPAPTEIDSESDDDDGVFLRSWRQELLDRTWTALASEQPTYHAVLRFRVENPDVPSPQMAERLSEQLGEPMRADRVRKAIQRAHERYAELLIDEVACSLGTEQIDAVRDELGELDLLKYCQSTLERRRARGR
jgi:RNA polymerase sigma-70 factor (ECF subfamily)